MRIVIYNKGEQLTLDNNSPDVCSACKLTVEKTAKKLGIDNISIEFVRKGSEE